MQVYVGDCVVVTVCHCSLLQAPSSSSGRVANVVTTAGTHQLPEEHVRAIITAARQQLAENQATQGVISQLIAQQQKQQQQQAGSSALLREVCSQQDQALSVATRSETCPASQERDGGRPALRALLPHVSSQGITLLPKPSNGSTEMASSHNTGTFRVTSLTDLSAPAQMQQRSQNPLTQANLGSASAAGHHSSAQANADCCRNSLNGVQQRYIQQQLQMYQSSLRQMLLDNSKHAGGEQPLGVLQQFISQTASARTSPSVNGLLASTLPHQAQAAPSAPVAAVAAQAVKCVTLEDDGLEII